MILNFEKIIPTSKQVSELYELLLDRKNSISHKDTPSLIEHNNFVLSNPYIAWYLIYKKEKLIGSLYLHSDNSIGLNSNKSKKEDVTEIIAFVKANHKPLPPIKSVRRGEFFINVSSNNGVLLKILKKIGKNEIQRSFIL
ncbi:MAG: hypothetical protein JJ840_07765 [Prochlorococcus marinus CUG1431]|uniref:Uncharacterized protein n=1 Tax=Prochlorococcus marinus CUG1433 TaxID=2774506 RepID=A0A9D9BT58_PROMR|nr:hypothetical protein [Prochlorococcus marinus CUG1433]MBO6981243.1 hypothetical protein [Prochlorococcus marinus CUG1431]